MEQHKKDNWKPSPSVLRRYAKDMETNTRLIDGDIAPYLRKVADWIERQAAIAAMPEPVEMGEDDLYQPAMDACRNADMSVDGPITHFIRALQAKARIVKRGNV